MSRRKGMRPAEFNGEELASETSPQPATDKTAADGSTRKVVTSMCGVCPAGCGVKVHLVNGKIDRLTPLKRHPLGIVCPRGMQAKEIVYSEDRLLWKSSIQRTGSSIHNDEPGPGVRVRLNGSAGMTPIPLSWPNSGGLPGSSVPKQLASIPAAAILSLP
jgi:hypothetical protein